MYTHLMKVRVRLVEVESPLFTWLRNGGHVVGEDERQE